MKIEHYSWGKIIIDGKPYTSDVIIYPDRVDASWWRKEGHNLHVEDMKELIDASPEGNVLVRADENEEILLITEIDPEKARNKSLNPLNNLFTDRRPEMYRNLTEQKS